MATAKRYRRSRRTSPMQELGFVFLLLTGTVIAWFWPHITSYDIRLIASILFVAVLFLGGGIYVFMLHKQRVRKRALQAVRMAHVDTMKGEDFEKYVAELLRSRGYKTRETPPSGDYGVDIIASKEGVNIAVQVKRYGKKLGLEPIQEAIAGMAVRQYGCTKAMVITNSTFTKRAAFLAAENGCELVDREKLGEWILMFQDEMLTA